MRVIEEKRYKIVVIGDAMSGKTKWTNAMLGHYKERPYIPTLGVDVHQIVVADGSIVFDIWDTAGQERFAGLADGYYIGAHTAVVFGQNTDSWVNSFKHVCRDASVIFAENCTKDTIVQKLLATCQNS